MTRRIPGRCAYCGTKTGCIVACRSHSRLPALDPHYRLVAPLVPELRRAA